MPITNIYFENNIFYCRAVGEITPNDAIRWAQQAEQFIETSAMPLVALMDATACTFITAKARTIFARASAIPNLQSAAIATHDLRIKQSAHLITMMALKNRFHIFDTVEAAATFVYQQVNVNQANV